MVFCFWKSSQCFKPQSHLSSPGIMILMCWANPSDEVLFFYVRGGMNKCQSTCVSSENGLQECLLSFHCVNSENRTSSLQAGRQMLLTTKPSLQTLVIFKTDPNFIFNSISQAGEMAQVLKCLPCKPEFDPQNPF